MKKISMLLALVFVLTSCGEAVEKEVVNSDSPVLEKSTPEIINTVSDIIEDTMKEEEKIMKEEEKIMKEEEKIMKEEEKIMKEEEKIMKEEEKVMKEEEKVMKEEEKVMKEEEKIMKEEEKVMKEEEKVMKEEEKVMKEEEKVMKEEEKVMKEEEKVMKEEAASTTSIVAAGTYQDYSELAVKSTAGNKVLFFAATWCPSCVAADKNIKAKTIPEGLNIFKVDYDSNTELRKKYGVTSQHTFVLVDDNMEKIKAMAGGRNSADIVNGLLN